MLGESFRVFLQMGDRSIAAPPGLFVYYLSRLPCICKHHSTVRRASEPQEPPCASAGASSATVTVLSGLPYQDVVLCYLVPTSPEGFDFL